MSDYRISRHPILSPQKGNIVQFLFNGKKLSGYDGEIISSSLFAQGIRIFGHHPKDNSPQGIFCANGQCSQCMVIVDGKPVKSCMTQLREGMDIRTAEGLPELIDSKDYLNKDLSETEIKEVKVLVIGGGPAGLNGAIELGKLGVDVLLVDDKSEAGGKLSLQTHNFFGSVDDCYAGTRGIDIGKKLTNEASSLESVEIWLNSTVAAVYYDKIFCVMRNGVFNLVKPEVVLIATGAREKTLAFPGSDLPGVYGAGAFQTLVNRDLIKCSDSLFIIGGGNVGVIAAYHALQAGINVAGLVEALPECGGYKVHVDKITRLGVPVFTSHSVVKVEGINKVEGIVISEVDSDFNLIAGTEKAFKVDTVLIAVGLNPVDELFKKSVEYGIPTFSAGDAEEISEASAAIFSGKITGRKIARELGINIEIPDEWYPLMDTLKSRPGKTVASLNENFYVSKLSGDDTNSESKQLLPENEMNVHPILHCYQEIPCDPCVAACPLGSIQMGASIMNLPEFSGRCVGCEKCVLACPGLAISLVYTNYDNENKFAKVVLPFEFNTKLIEGLTHLVLTNYEGLSLCEGKILGIKDNKKQDHRKLISLEVPYEFRNDIAGFKLTEQSSVVVDYVPTDQENDPIICLCERVRKSSIVKEIKNGIRDMNQLKALLRTGMGACGGKTCTSQILRIFKEEGVPLEEVTLPTARPFVAEVHLGAFLTQNKNEDH